MNDLFHNITTVEAFPKKKDLRAHQQKAIDLIRQSFGSGNRRVVLQAATGFGKTLVAAKIIEAALAKGKRVIFTVPAINLIEQTVAAFEAERIRDIGVMQANHPRTNPLARVQVASVQTLARREIPPADLVIVDECHVRSRVIEKLMKAREDVCFIGMSATPWAKGMGLLWQDLVIPSSLGDLIEGGYLSRFRVFAPDLPDLSSVKTVAGDYHEGQTSDVMQNGSLMASVVETWLAKGQNRPTLLFGANCAHAKAMQKEFEAAGIAAGYCDAFTDTVERKILEQQFRSGEIKIACSVRTLTTGVDWPVSCIIDAAPTKSEILHVQKIGRGLRINEGTENLLILDHAGNSLRLGLVTGIEHTKLDTTAKSERQQKPKAKKLPKECIKCAVLHTGLICPHCGHERKPVAGVETLDGELIEITASPHKPTKEEKQTFWSMALWLDGKRRKGGRLAKALYKQRFEVWPKGLHGTPIDPNQAFLNYETSRRIAYANRNQGRAS